MSSPVYLQLFQQFVVVSNGSLQRLQEFLLGLQLLGHRTRPPGGKSGERKPVELLEKTLLLFVRPLPDRRR